MSDLAAAAAFRYCRLEKDGAILIITIERPEVLNALNEEAHFELNRAFDLYAAATDLRVAIVTGAGERAFCVGTDLKALALRGDYAYPPGGFGGITKRFDLWKPVIAAVNGLCLGGGLEIVAACDLAIASEHAEFALPEPRVGLAALGGGALQRLARQMPMKEAMGLVLTAKRIAADEARRISLINEVVPRGTALARAGDRPRHARVRAAFAGGVETGPSPECRRARSGGSDAPPLPGRRTHAGQRGRHRGSAGVRRKAQAALAGPLKAWA